MRRTHTLTGKDTEDMFETLSIEKVDFDSLIDSDTFSVSEAFARLSAFVNGTDVRQAFTIDNATLNALRVAACQLVGLDKDVHTPYQTFTKKNAAGKNVTVRVTKNVRPPKDATLKDGIAHTYSGKAKREGIRLLRETRGIRVQNRAQGEGLHVVGFTRDAQDEGQDIDN